MRDELAQSAESAVGQNHSLKEWTREKLNRVSTQVKSLMNFATRVESLTHEQYSTPRERASALEGTQSQREGEEGDGSRDWTAGQTAAASSSSVGTPTLSRCQSLHKFLSPLSIPTSPTHFSTIQSDVRAGAVQVEISDSEQWSSGDAAILQNKEAKKVREVGSLIFETPIQHHYEAGVEIRSLLSTELMEELWIPVETGMLDSGLMVLSSVQQKSNRPHEGKALGSRALVEEECLNS